LSLYAPSEEVLILLKAIKNNLLIEGIIKNTTKRPSMTCIKRLAFCILLCNFIGTSLFYGQSSFGGTFQPNPSDTPCLTDQDYAFYTELIAINQQELDLEGIRFTPATSNEVTVDFIWPVIKAADSPYKSSWAISNYVDHNSATGELSDWNCDTRTFDTADSNHKGLDIFPWPFWWKQMEENQTKVIAAAAGQIIFKNDGSFDRNCASNNDLWNAIYIEHSDGSIAWYGHLKNGSLIDKGVGDMVSQGEFLGIIGSSGNSTGPHLHFEVYDSDNNLIDPYQGPCNNLNANSWWVDQKPYLNTGINAVLTHTNVPNFNTCPETEETFESNQFNPNDNVWFGSYFRDQLAGTTAIHEVFTPSGTLFVNWENTFTDLSPATWRVQNFTINNEQGVWMYRVTYNGEQETHLFNVGQLSIEDPDITSLTAYPNPTKAQFTLASLSPLETVEIIDMTGRMVSKITNINALDSSFDLSQMSNGIYFLRVKMLDEEAIATLRIVKR